MADKTHEKFMNDFHRMLDQKDFKTKAEAEVFINQYFQNGFPSIPNKKLTPQQQAEDLIFEAGELSPDEGMAKAEEALRLDRNCIVAYEYLGSIEPSVEVAIVLYEKGVDIGRKIFGGKYLKENKGHFWGLHETRPFMRCMMQLSDNLYMVGELQKALALMEEMIELNPNDNQGVRDFLMTLLIELGKDKTFEKYDEMYKDDEMAHSLFNRALYTFKNEGISEKTNKKLKKAIKYNPFVPKLLFSKNNIEYLPPTYGCGDENEAIYYAFLTRKLWKKIPGALQWLKSINR